tara:strand:- start:892 stop:1380 length:489 start_codon:yes stop_codon:yes gene_type:complete
MSQIFIGVGSNVDREKNIASCINKLKEIYESLSISPIYETASMGFSGPNFYNLVCKFETDEKLHDLKLNLNKIEIAHGRTHGETKFSSRTLDIDILYYDSLVMETDNITVPRSEIIRYDFVLRPLVDIAPDFMHPKEKLTNQEILNTYDIEKLIINTVNIEI